MLGSTISEDVVRKLERLAKAENRSRSNMLERIILYYLAKNRSGGLPEPSGDIGTADQ